MSGRASCSTSRPFSKVIGIACKASIISEIARANAAPAISVSDMLTEDKSSIGPSQSWMTSKRPPPWARAIIADAIIALAHGGGLWEVIQLWLGPMLLLSSISISLTLMAGAAFALAISLIKDK